MKNKNSFNNIKNEFEPDGYAWIINGIVHVKNEQKFGIPPAINPCDGIKLIINSKECNHLTFISEKDCIEIIPIESEDQMGIDIEVEENGLKAYLSYTPPAIYKSILLDKPPANKLDLEINKELISKKNVSKLELLNKLKEQGILFGTIEDSINKICEINKEGRYLVAEGIKPIEPIDDWIEYFFDDDTQSCLVLKEDTSGNIDYRNSINYKDTKPGDVLAIYHAGSAGTPGTAVNGNAIEVRQPQKLHCFGSKTVEYNENTCIVRALKPGKPTKQVNGNKVIFQICEKLALDEVSLKTGNINFKGDIEVNGNVYESMQVTSKNNVYIKGNVNFSTIIAANCIYIKGGLISGNIITGADLLSKDPKIEIEKIINEIDSLMKNIESLSPSELKKLNLNSFPNTIKYFINNYNKSLPKTIYEVISNLRRGNYDIDENLFTKIVSISKTFLTDCAEFNNLKSLHDIVSFLSELFFIKVTNDVKEKCDVEIDYILNSEISSKGNVVIRGKGCFNSKINAIGSVFVNGTLRGGEIISEKSIDVNICGAEIGVKTFLSVPEDGIINIRTVNPDTTIKVGKLVHKFLSSQKMVTAKIVNCKLII